MSPTFDLITLGRCGMDLFSQNIGAPFVEIQGFDAHIGGSPTNIAVAASRLGLRTALLTAVGPDLVGDFVLAHLAAEGIATDFIPRKPGTKTGLAIVGVEPPDRFPLVFYRDNPADIWLDVDDVKAAPVAAARALLLSGTALSRGSCQEATLYAAEQAHAAGVTTYVDLDLRPDQWADPAAFRAALARSCRWWMSSSARKKKPMRCSALRRRRSLPAGGWKRRRSTNWTGRSTPCLPQRQPARWCSNAARGARRCTVRGRRRSPWRASRSRCSTPSARATPLPAGCSTAAARGGTGQPACAWPMPAAPSW
jgi:hypothetical protein